MSTTKKVAHVRAAKQDRYHTCHWPDCTRQCPPAMWGCAPHWFRLPLALRNDVWSAYRIGQENRMDPSDRYLAVIARVEAWIAALHEGMRVASSYSPVKK